MSPIPIPAEAQLRWQRAQFGLFCHFGINTFHNREWSAGQWPPETFAPTDFDPHQWVDIALSVGAKYLVLTAKHGDGFCLWPTDTTPYSVRNSPGQIDIVGEVAKACRDRGLHFGLYLSPWDRNCAVYSDGAAYDRFYCAQLTELCTRYGELFELWFDGGGSEGRDYNWDAVMDVVRAHQPGAMVFNMGPSPTIRWAGNEDGVAADPCLYAVAATDISAFTSESEQLEELRYLPPECDVAIRQHWFWQDDDLPTLKTPEHLLGIYYLSVGLGANLLLNVGPNRQGRIDPHDEAALRTLADEIRRRFASPLAGDFVPDAQGATLRLSEAARFDHLVLREHLEYGQRVMGYRVLADGREIASGHTIGAQKWHVFPALEAREIRLELGPECLPEARITAIEAHLTGVSHLPEIGAPLDYSAWERKADARDAHIAPWRPTTA